MINVFACFVCNLLCDGVWLVMCALLMCVFVGDLLCDVV